MGAEVGCDGFRVTTKIEGAHPLHTEYPLLPGDLLVRDFDGTFTKEAPGLAVIGFVLSDADVAAMEPVKFTRAGLLYSLTPSADPREQGGER